MITKWYAFWAAVIGGLFCFCLWRTWKRYFYRSPAFRVIKACVDTILVVWSAAYLPVLLGAWIVLWATRPVKNRALQVTLGVLLGSVMAALSSTIIEIVAIIGIFAVDDVTNSLYGAWQTAKKEDRKRSLKLVAA